MNLERSGLPDPLDQILASGGPFRYVTPDQWDGLLRAKGRDDAADRMRASIDQFGQSSVSGGVRPA